MGLEEAIAEGEKKNFEGVLYFLNKKGCGIAKVEIKDENLEKAKKLGRVRDYYSAVKTAITNLLGDKLIEAGYAKKGIIHFESMKKHIAEIGVSEEEHEKTVEAWAVQVVEQIRNGQIQLKDLGHYLKKEGYIK